MACPMPMQGPQPHSSILAPAEMMSASAPFAASIFITCLGEGIKTLSVPQRATITNMGAELGATTSVFPSDDVTRAFLKAQGREDQHPAPPRRWQACRCRRRWGYGCQSRGGFCRACRSVPDAPDGKYRCRAWKNKHHVFWLRSVCIYGHQRFQSLSEGYCGRYTQRIFLF